MPCAPTPEVAGTTPRSSSGDVALGAPGATAQQVDDARCAKAIEAARATKESTTEAPAAVPYACSACGHEQSSMDPCARYGSVRVVLISVLEELFGADWRCDGDYTAMAARDQRADAQDELEIAEAQIAKWIKVGDRVDYCAVIGKPPTKRGLTVRAAPHQAHGGRWVVFLSGHAGFVSVLAVQPSEDA